jgi:hypothetical protein
MKKRSSWFGHYRVGLLAVIFVLAFGARTEGQVFFDGSIDRQWESIRKQCTLIEGVPIISRRDDLSSRAIALSVLMSYHESQLPILGPGRPKRIEQLFSRARFRGAMMTKAESNLLETALYRAEDESYRQFLKYARLHPSYTEGQVRTVALQDSSSLHPAQTFQTLSNVAEARGQHVKIVQVPPSFSTIKKAVSNNLIGVLAFNNDNDLYPIVGYTGDHLAVAIVSDDAKSSMKPASELLLTESDRASSGNFARKAREYLQRRMVAVDVVTSCRTDRPPGLKLINLEKLSPSRFYLIAEWAVDIQQTIMKFQGADDETKDR